MSEQYEVTPEVREVLRKEFEKDPRVIKLRQEHALLLKHRNYVKAERLRERINEIFEDFVQTYIKETAEEYEKVDVNNIGMSDEDKAKLDATVTVMFMCCDLIETAVAEGDELLHKYDETLRLNLFDDINKIVEAAKQKRRMLNSHSIVPHDDIWGDKCDDMYEMMYNKAKAILKHFDK